MENFREQVKRRRNINVVLLVFLVTLFAVLIIMDATGCWAGYDESESSMAGFRSGFASALIGFSIMKIVIYTRALKDEKKLKAMYINETDERSLMISQKIASSSFKVTIMGLAIACVVVSFFSKPILETLVCIISFILAVEIGFKFYYTRKY